MPGMSRLDVDRRFRVITANTVSGGRWRRQVCGWCAKRFLLRWTLNRHRSAIPACYDTAPVCPEGEPR